MTFFEKQYKRFHKLIFKAFKLTFEGIENVPAGGFIVCANHTALFDPIIIDAVLNMPVHFMAKAELFKIPLLKGLITKFGAYPVNRGGTDVKALKKTVEFVKNGEPVGIFPQGTRMPGQPLKPEQAKSGLGLTAYRSHGTVLPIYIKTAKNRVKLFSKTHVIVGKPISFEEFNFTDGSMREINAASRYAFGRICTMAEVKDDNVS